ncbi:MAG TPA: YncE family protein, partial [Burkholderiales bacterium]
MRSSLSRLALFTACALGGAGASAAPFAYVTNQGSHDVTVVDLADYKVVATVPVGKAPAGVAVSSAARKAFITNPESKSLSVIDLTSNRVVDTLPAGDGPVGIAAA